MKRSNRWSTTLAALAAASALVACGGGGSSSTPAVGTTPVAVTPSPSPSPAPVPEAGAPALVGIVAIDGRNWINYRRGQIGIPVVAQNPLIDRAAQAHSDYQRLNGQITHDEVAGNPGFTGVGELERLAAAGYVLDVPAGYAYGEVISATSSGTGAFMVDELITAIYHRFVIFEPMFKEIGTGSATSTRGTTYFTSDFAANHGFGRGIGRGALVSWPYSGQTGVTPNFFSNNEEPDPDPDRNEVGYPISVHADISAYVTVKSFTVRPRGGAILPAKLLQHDVDAHTVSSAAAIVPQAVLKAATVYDVSFDGVVDGIPVTRNWSFTTK
jgi:uncharacterized protein YkwD